ncbi:MAG: SdrD B-like domain-containing protein [Candidatus Promineifilaceae bacterium]
MTYTLRYTNNGTLPLEYVWIWDDVDTAGSVISSTVSPPSDPAESTENRVAWYIGTITPNGGVDSSGTLTFTIRTDAKDQDLPDGYLLVNYGFFGINQGSLPSSAALTDTTTTLVNAPTIAINKSDGRETIGTGELLTYTISVANSGSVLATGLVLTDVLPSEVNLAGTPTPPPDSLPGDPLVWDPATLGDLAPGESLTITIPVSVSWDVESFTVITNTAIVEYQNQAGYVYVPKTAVDETTVLRRAGFVDGYAYDDLNGNGVFDGGETGLSGVTITLPAAQIPVTTTDAGGYYHFRVESEGPVSVTASTLPGFFHTTAPTVYTDTVFGLTRTVDYGFAPVASPFGVIFGTVYEDLNHDGQRDLGEGGISGVTITSTRATTSPVTTDPFGNYTLRFNSAGSATITEINPDGYLSTTPDGVDVDVVIGSSDGSPIDFGDFLGIKITGKVFEDANGNGTDDGEAGLANADVSAGIEIYSTDSTGVYTLFLTLTGGSVLISESDPTGYVSTVSIPGAGMSVIDANTLSIDAPVSGVEYSGGDFGDMQASTSITISGYVWDDNGDGGGGIANGQRDGAEPGLPGVVVHLSNGLPQETDFEGNFELHTTAGQAITLTETDPDGYVSTNAIAGVWATKIDNGSLLFDALSPGSTSSGNFFGDVQTGQVFTVTGFVWDDNGAGGGTSGDGIWDTFEPPLSGATVSASSSMQDVTGPDGAFLLHTPAGQSVTITESNPAGYVSTGSIAGNDAVRVDDDTLVVSGLAGGLSSSGNFFGDVIPADLAISKSDNLDPVTAGTSMIYAIVVDNNGPSDATGVIVTDTMPADVSYVSDSVSQGNFDPITGVWTVGAVNSGGSATLSIEVFVESFASGLLENIVVVVADQFDDDLSDNTDTEYTTVETEADLAITKLDHPDPVAAGDVLTYTIVYTNIGPSDAPGVTITDTLPDEFEFSGVVTATPPLPGFVQDGQTLTWYINNLTPGVTGTIVLTGTVSPGALGVIANWVAINSSTTDPNQTNNEHVETTYIGNPDLATIYGFVFEDTNGSGKRDAGESGLPNVLVTIDGSEFKDTDELGLYFFLSPDTGTHKITETDPEGYFSTTPNGIVVDVVLGKSYNVDFGDASEEEGFASIFGIVFEDADGDGQQDDDEVGIEGVILTLDNIRETTSDVFGSYTFSTTVTGTHRVVETDPVGYFSTTPNRVVIDVQLGEGYEINFGDAPDVSDFSAIYGTVFDDSDGDGVWDDDELGISSVVVKLDQSEIKFTDRFGNYTFRVDTPGTHNIEETDPLDYISTTSNSVDTDVQLGTGFQIDFGDAWVWLCNPDSYEEDDTVAQAEMIGAVQSQVHDFCDDTVDWLKFDAVANQTYTITTSSWGRRADTYLALVDRDGATILAANDDYSDAPDFSSRIVWEVGPQGTYFVRVTSQSELTGYMTDYDISLDRTDTFFNYMPIILNTTLTQRKVLNRPAAAASDSSADRTYGTGDLNLGEINHSCPDSYEIDDTWQSAGTLFSGVPQVHSFDSDPSLYAADKDFAWFELPPQGDIVVSVTPLSSTTYLELYDEHGNSLGLTGIDQFSWIDAPTGLYYLGISPMTPTFGCTNEAGYTLEADITPLYKVYLPIISG